MSEFTSMAEIKSFGDQCLLKVGKEKQFRELLRNLGSGHKVKITIKYEDQRQEWINEWYNDALMAEKEGDIIIRHCKDATFVCATRYDSVYDAACAAPRHDDKYDQRTGIAVAYAKICGREIPEYI